MKLFLRSQLSGSKLRQKKLIGRSLTDDEINSVKKGIESGMLFDIDTVFRTVIENAAESK